MAESQVGESQQYHRCDGGWPWPARQFLGRLDWVQLCQVDIGRQRRASGSTSAVVHWPLTVEVALIGRPYFHLCRLYQGDPPPLPHWKPWFRIYYVIEYLDHFFFYIKNVIYFGNKLQFYLLCSYFHFSVLRLSNNHSFSFMLETCFTFVSFELEFG